MSDVENQARATPHTMYRVGSISKTITATGLMLLVEEGRVDLDKPAIDYLPEDVRPRAYEEDVGDITVRHLLNHRAGMPAHAESFFEDDPEGRRPLAETVRRYGIIAYQPGWSYIYCNLGCPCPRRRPWNRHPCRCHPESGVVQLPGADQVDRFI